MNPVMRVCLLFGAFLVLAGASQAIVFDDFSSGAYDSGPVTSNTIAWQNGTMINGVRGTFVGITSNPLSETARLRIVPGSGAFIASSGLSLDAFFQAAYGFANGSTSVGSNPLNINLMTQSQLRVTFLGSDLPMVATAIVFTNNGAGSFTRVLNLPGGITNGQTATWDFSADAASLGDVDAIVFDFDSSPSGDFGISRLESVPEPATMAALGLGVAALLRRRKK
jgi:hypothetical protein